MVTLSSQNSGTEHTPTGTRSTGTSSSKMGINQEMKMMNKESFEDDRESLHSGVSSNYPNNDTNGTSDLYTELEVAKKEDIWVFWLRILTTLVLLAVAVTVCVVVYLEGRKSETKAFEQDFSDLGEKMVQSFEAKVEQRLGVIEAFAESVTSDANHSFPYVTPPNYAFRAETTAILAQLFFLIFIPIVQKEQLAIWNQYVQQNTHWRVEGWAQIAGVNPETVNETEVGFKPFPPQMMNFHNPNGPGPVQKITPNQTQFYPIWCAWPVNPGTFGNVDMYGDKEHQVAIDTTLNTGKPTFEISYDYIDKEKDGRYGMLKANPHADYQDDPHAVAFFPIFDKFSYYDDSDSDPEPPKVSGLFLVIVYWRTNFDDLLPPGAHGIFVILENTCDQVYTYRIDGTYSLFVGHGDLHDPKYSYLEAGTSIGNIINAQVLDDNKNGCHYSIRVYPSQDFEDDHRSNKPWIYVLVLASLFLFTSAVFLIYDHMVEQRQKIVLQSAQQSGKLVNTLFPEDVRDQLYQEQQEEANKKQKQKGWENSTVPNEPATDALVNRALTMDNNTEHGKKAIASLYPESTIFFADLVGFTSWSAKRTPVEVFQLLETIYEAFDNIALKRDVFKVETIGDCYVAATGLPQPQPDHAIIMCKFATDCMNKMKVMMSSLADTMGEDTADLAMRVGLHSGPVTAGVLRGQKSRFQLFGDTVNTASRMESNGLPHRIHVSQATADALRAKGKRMWLTPRPDKVQAKGKGLLQTYFVDTTSKSRSVVSGLTVGDTTIGSDIDMDNDLRDVSGSTENAPQHSGLPDDLAGFTIDGAGAVLANENNNHDGDSISQGDETQSTAPQRDVFTDELAGNSIQTETEV
ncbi:Receptor-type guanylate cyclase gcy [Seminavis robusta]|uniref:Receptor-type guanylate cyclase gcy n=1 Tax=Seminavis robusta TaxID=568900 RepID=A0A9N8HHW4_9STRA|nr:Receptor-type guanylate cyclase gcy [Seminavis robusta]|eukprot:Sro662_g183410.1 Receptor-type guanylate cyclase gcy (858) ;mRNA; f:43690-46868